VVIKASSSLELDLLRMSYVRRLMFTIELINIHG